MAENKAASFETSLKRLEEIVHHLEGDTVSLDESVALYREGRELARRCEALLRTAQEQIDAAVAGNPAEKTPNALAGGRASLDDGLLGDEVPF